MIKLLKVYGGGDVDVAYSKTSVWLFMLNGLPVTFSPFLFENKLHVSFGMFHNRCVDFDAILKNYGITAQGVLSRTQFMDLIEFKDVPDLHVSKTGYSE